MNQLEKMIVRESFTEEETLKIEELLNANGGDWLDALEETTEDDNKVWNTKEKLNYLKNGSFAIGTNNVKFEHSVYAISFQYDAEKKDTLKNKFSAKWNGNEWTVKILTDAIIEFLQNN